MVILDYPKDCIYIDEIEPGFMFNISFWPLQDENFYDTHKKWKENIEKDRKLKVIFPAIVVDKIKTTNKEFPTYRVAFINRWRTGELSGWIYFEDLLIWRYFPYTKDDFKNNIPQEGLIPEWFIETVKESIEDNDGDSFELTLEDVYYTKIIDGRRMKCYPFRNE